MKTIRSRCLGAALLLAALATIASIPGRADAAQRVPLGLMITNWDCPPCFPANEALNEYIPGQGNSVAIIRIHCWWPGPDDPMYLANPPQSEYLIYNMPGGADYAPHMWMDNIVDLGSLGPDMVAGFEARKQVPSPLTLALNFDDASDQTSVTIDVVDPLAPGDYRLFVAITEDNVAAAGTNGETHHNQVFRWLFPDQQGTQISSAVGTQSLVVDTPLSTRWNFANLRATAFVQEMNSGEVINAGTMFCSEGTTTATPDGVPQVSRIDGAAPNPFNPLTRIDYSLAADGPVSLRIYDLAGRVVRTLVDVSQAAGSHSVTWQGVDDAGRSVASGVYLLRMQTAGRVDTRKLVLSK